MSKPTHNIIYKARSYQGEDGSWDGVLYLRQREEAQELRASQE
jgi:hypothetical protein